MSEVEKFITSLEDIQKALGGVDRFTKEYSETFKKTLSAMESNSDMLAKGVKRSSDEYKKSSEQIKNYIKQMAILKAQSRELYDAQEKLTQQVERAGKGWGAYTESIGKGLGKLSGGLSTFASYTAAFGTQSMGVKELSSKLLKYNQSMFDLSRIQQIAGRNTSDLSNVFKKVKENTTMAKNQFVEMASSIGKVNIGIAPTADQIADVASMMKNQFGPSIDIIKQKTEAFFQIQSDWPDMADDILRAQDALKKGDEAGAAAIKANTMARYRQGGASSQVLKEMDQMMTKTTKEQQEFNKYGEHSAKASQEWEDTSIDAAKKMEPALIGLADASKKLAVELGKIPAILATISIAMEAAGFLSATGGISLLTKGLGKLAQRAMAGKGAGLAINAAGGASSTLGGAVASGAGTAGSAGAGVAGAAGVAGKASGMARLAGVGSRALGAVNPIGAVAAAGMAGYGAGKLLDYGVGKLTGGTSISDAIAGGANSLLGNRTTNEQINADTAKQTGKKQFGMEYSKRMNAEGGFNQETQNDPSKFLAIHDKITKELTKEQKITGIIFKNIEKNTKEAKKEQKTQVDQNAAFATTVQSQNRNLDIIQKGISSMQSLVSLGEKLGVANVDAADGQKKQAEYARATSESYTENVLKLVKSNLEANKVSINIQTAGKASEKLKDAQIQIEQKIKESKDGSEQQKGLLIAQRDIMEQQNKIQQQNAAVVDALVAKMSTQLNTNNQLNDMYENRLSTERQLMEAGQFGLGASVEMMQKQVDLMQRRIETNKEGLAQAELSLGLDGKDAKKQLEKLQNARSDYELRQASLEISQATGKSQGELIAYAKQYNAVTTDSMKQQQKILEITKQVREGYLSAMKQAAFGFGQFGKIIGNQTRGASQLMTLVKKVSGSAKLNTMAMGGQQSAEETKAGLGKDVAYSYTTSGVEKGVSKNEEKNRLNRNWKFAETERLAKEGKLPVGTGVAASAADVSVMQQRASGGGNGGGVIRTNKGLPPNMAQGTTAVQKGSMFTPGATFPGQQGIPANYAGGAAVVPMAASLMDGSNGQIANPTGGPALTPTPLKGASKGAQSSEWLQPMMDKQDETNVKLNDILGQLKSGMKVTAMNTA